MNSFSVCIYSHNVLGGIMAPQGSYILILGTCEYVTLYGKRGFVGLVKVMDLEMGRLTRIIHVGSI